MEFDLRVAALVVGGLSVVSTLHALRHRPNAPPGSSLIRWTVTACVTATAGVIGFMYWLALR